MPLRVGFDLDGTLADMSSALHREALNLFGDEATVTDANARMPALTGEQGGKSSDNDPQEDERTSTDAMQQLQLTARQRTALWDHVKNIDNFWFTLPELEPGIIARLATTALVRRWEVIFLTTRPSTVGDLVQRQSQRWLEAHGFQYPSVYVVHRSRGKISDALQLDAFVDDRPENCLDIAVESKAKVILVWHGNLTEVPAGVTRVGVQPVATIAEALALLERLDDDRRKPSMMRSIRRALGANDPSL